MRRAGIVTVVVLGGAVLLSPRPCQAQAELRSLDAQQVEKYKGVTIAYDKALAALDKKDKDGALDALSICFSNVPDFPDGHFLMAKILYGEKEFTRALGEIEKAEAGHEKVADLRELMAKNRRSVLQDRVKQKEEAIRGQEELLPRALPEERLRVLGKISQLQGERDTLLREIQTPSGGPVPVPARYTFLHGNILLRLDRPSEAVAQYEAALAVEPDHGHAANNLASLYYTAGQHAKALEVVSAARKAGGEVNPELAKAIETALAR